MKLAILFLLLASAPLLAAPERPSCEAITSFAADPVPAAPSQHFKGFKVTREDLCAILRTYHEVTEAQWQHEYHHVAFADRTGSITLLSGAVLKWLVRPGGLSTIAYPDGTVLFLARERGR